MNDLQIESFRMEIIQHVYYNKAIDNNLLAMANKMVDLETGISISDMYNFEQYIDDLLPKVISVPNKIAQEVYRMFLSAPQATNTKIVKLVFPDNDGETNLYNTIKLTMLINR